MICVDITLQIIVKSNLDISTLSFQKEEVEFAKWATFDEITSLFNDGLFCHTHYDDLKKYRKINSQTPGHPELNLSKRIEIIWQT